MAKINSTFPCTIYGLVSTIDEKFIRYIGQTSRQLKQRFRDHFYSMEQGSKLPVYKWMRSHISQGFSIKCVVLKENAEYNVDEIEFINKYKKEGYNLLNCTDGGEGSFSRTQTEETKRKISLANTGNKWSDEAKEKRKLYLKTNHPMLGKKHTEESKSKMRKPNTKPSPLAGKVNRWTDEQKKLIGQSRSEYSKVHGHCRAGVSLSQETKDKIRNSLVGKKMSDESRLKMSLAHKKRHEVKNGSN